MKKIIYLAFLTLLSISSCKKSEPEPKLTIVGTWNATQYINILSNCGNGSNPGGGTSTKGESELNSDILIISPDGTGQLTANSEVLATFKWSFSESPNDPTPFKLTISDYKIVKAKNDNIILNTLFNHVFVVNTYATDGIGFYSLVYPQVSNPCFTDMKVYDYKRVSY